MALTTLIGFVLPKTLERTSWMPASSRTARADAPAFTPVPRHAGRRSTWVALNFSRISWGIVVWTIGTSMRFFFPSWIAFSTAKGTSFALP